MTTKKLILILALLMVLVALVAVPVSAETLTGNLGTGIPITTSESYSYSTSLVDGANRYHNFTITHVENFFGITSLIRFDTGGSIPTFDSGAPAGLSTHYDASDKSTGATLFSGTFGYQRVYNYLGVEQPGYQYITIENYNSVMLGKTGRVDMILAYSDREVRNITQPQWAGCCNINENLAFPSWYSTAGAANTHVAIGQLSLVRTESFLNPYTITKPSGIGITGTITKNNCPSQAFVYNANTGAIIASQNTVLNTDLDFAVSINSVVPAVPIILGAKSSSGNYYNSSILFPTQSIVYGINLSPNNIAFGATTSAMITGVTTSGVITAVSWFADYPGDIHGLNSHKLYESGSTTNALNYVLRSGTWYGWSDTTQDFTINKGSTMPNPVSIVPDQSGTYNIWVTIYRADGTVQTPYAPIIVGSGGQIKTLVLQAADYTSGSLVTDTSWSVKNLAKNTWSNASGSPNDGTRSVQYASGTPLFVQVTHPYYSTATLNQTLQGNDIWTLQLYPTGTGSTTPTNSTLMIVIKGVDSVGRITALSQAQVVLKDGQTKITTESGVVQFTVLNNTVYSADVQATGYTRVTKSFLVTGSVYSTQILLPSIYITTAPTLAPGETATPTPAPTIDSRSNAQKSDSVIDIIYDNAENIAWALIALFFLGCVKMALKGWGLGKLFGK